MNENGMLLEFQIEEKKDRYCFTIDDKQNQNRTEKIPYHFECQVFVFSFHFESNGDVTKKNCLMEINFGSLNPYNVQCSIRNQRIFF